MSESPVFRVIFANNDKNYEIYANQVNEGRLFGFVEVEELLFSNRSGLVVDPSEEKLKAEFGGVKRTQIPMHSIIRIDEVEKLGISKISEGSGSVVTPFPMKPPMK